MSENEFARKKKYFLNSLNLTIDEINKLERSTVGQNCNEDWQKHRRVRLTASNFGRVCKLRNSTSRANMVKSILYDIFQGNSATQ